VKIPLVKNVFFLEFRTSAAKVGLAKLAEKIREHNFHALLIIGGYEVNKKLDFIFFVEKNLFPGLYISSSNV
jgi:hypothetical protein